MSELKVSMFDGVRSYNAFLYAIDVFTQLEKMQKAGYLFFYGNEPVSDYFFIDIEKIEAGTRKNNCICLIVGCTFGGKDYKQVYITKYEIDDYLSNLKVVKPEHIKKFKLENQD